MITPEQCRMARAALGLGVRDLARIANVAAMTVTRFENGRSQGHPDTLSAIRRALEKAGVIFVEENGDGPGVRLRKGKKRGEK
jgi:transcriptional regulator with XRE-family HTH domain